MKQIVIYCGSQFGADPQFASFAGQISEQIAKANYGIVYGGGSVGLMGICADAAMASSGHVKGIIPTVFVTREQAHRNISELVEVPSMSVRKEKLIEEGDAFIILPGGIGTLEELSTTISHFQIEQKHVPPILIANVDGFYDPLKAQIEKYIRYGFTAETVFSTLSFHDSVESMMETLKKSFA